MTYPFPQRRFDGSGIGVMTIGGDALRDTVRDGARRTEERFRCGLVPLLTQEDVDQVPFTINGPVEIGPASFDFDVMPVGRGACPWFPAGAVPQPLARTRREPFDSP